MNRIQKTLRKWLGITDPVQLVEAEQPRGISINSALLAQVRQGNEYAKQTVADMYVFHRKVEAPKLPASVRNGFTYDAANDPGALGNAFAMDDAASMAAYNYANQQCSGMGFAGYGYLSELTQRSEYRSPVETIANEATREFIELVINGEEADGNKDDELAEDADASELGKQDPLQAKLEKMEAAIVEFKLRDHFRKLSEVDGFFGRAQLFIDIDTGNKSKDLVLQLPLIVSPETIKKGSLRGFKVVEPIWTSPFNYNANDPTAADFYKPRAWFVMGKRVHASRLLTFISREVPDLLKPAYNFGGISLSQLMEPYVFQWLRTRNSVSDLIHNFSICVLKTNMGDVLQGGSSDGKGLLDRAALFTNNRDNQGVMLIDKTREEMEILNASLSNLDKLQAQAQEHMSAPSHIPLVKLTGVTPAGLNANSDGEIKVWYDWITSYQIATYGKHMQHVLNIIQLHLFGEIEDAISYKFVVLDSPTVKELAEIRKSDADSAGVYIDKGVISPDEVRAHVASDPDSGYNNLSGAAPGPPEAGLMEQEHALGQEGAEADHGRGEESAESAHERAVELEKQKAKSKPAAKA